MNKYNYELTIHRSSDLVKEKIFAQRALTKVGHTAYDFEGLLLRQPIELLTGTWLEKGDKNVKMYCSEYVAWVYGIEKSYRFSPEDMFEWCKNNYFYEIKL
jgi:hypothetical protein